MFDYNKVDVIVKKIVEGINPYMVIVFGSVARCEARNDSDLDLLVVYGEDISEKEMYCRVSSYFIGMKLDFDLIVMNYKDFERYRHNESSFTYEIISTGRVLYSREVN